MLMLNTTTSMTTISNSKDLFGLRQQYLAALADEKNYQQQVTEQKEIFQKMASKRDAWNSQKLSLDKMEDLYKSL
ncbi:hypothetical protein, partial [Citrobacter freundii]|uniref:hypothetical protein n=1 Tax=Citrobacter freundii TaxID=546 RepID=UPI000FE0C5DA